MSDEWLLDSYNPVSCPVYHDTFGIGTIIKKLPTGYYTVHYAKYEGGGEINYTLTDLFELYENLRNKCLEQKE